MSSLPANEIPLACDLTAIDAGQRERHQDMAAHLMATRQAVEELPDGYVFQYPVEDAMLVAEFISFERLCCPFFRLALEIEPGAVVCKLKISGSEQIKQFIQAEMGVS